MKTANNFIQKALRKLILIFGNNIPVNNLLVILKKDYLIKKIINNWAVKKYDHSKSPQENVGYSHIPAMQELVNKSHVILKEKINLYLHNRKSVLDIGCGTGLYLADFPSSFKLYGIDLNSHFLEVSKTIVPNAIVKQGNYLEEKFDTKFDAIISFGVLMYFEPSKIKILFKKLHDDLNDNGVLLIQYPQAMSIKDLYYPDLSYIKYSPDFLEKAFKPYFNILEHKHFYDERKIKSYDPVHYYYPDGQNKRLDTIQNTYLLVGQKK